MVKPEECKNVENCNTCVYHRKNKDECALTAWKTERRICLECGKEFIPEKRYQSCCADCGYTVGSLEYFPNFHK